MDLLLEKNKIKIIDSLEYIGLNKIDFAIRSFSYADLRSKRFPTLAYVKLAAQLTCVCNFSFPESEGDALLVEVQDKRNSIQGRATIPVSSLTDNPVCVLYL